MIHRMAGRYGLNNCATLWLYGQGITIPKILTISLKPKSTHRIKTLMETLVLVGAAAIFLLAKNASAKRAAARQQIQSVVPTTDYFANPCIVPYTTAVNSNRYMEELLKHGVKPAGMTFGPKGIPQYYYPRPGGNGFFIINAYDT